MKVLVIGDSCIDKFVYGKVNRLSPEAPVPIIEPYDEKISDGMAGNVVQNLSNLGLIVDIITNKTKSIKMRYVEKESNQMLLRVDVDKPIDPLGEIVRFLKYKDYDAVIISDYNKGFLSTKDIKIISEMHPLTFLDTKKQKINENFHNIKFLKINEKEFNINNEYLETFPNDLIVTMGSNGAMHNGKTYPVENPSAIFDLTGAGDVFLASLVFKYLETKSIEDSIIFANTCASLSVQKRGTSVIDKKDLI